MVGSMISIGELLVVKRRLSLVLFSLHEGRKKSCSPERSINQAESSAIPCTSDCLSQRLAFLSSSGCLACLLATLSSASLDPRDTSLSQASPGKNFVLRVPLFRTETCICAWPGLRLFRHSGCVKEHNPSYNHSAVRRVLLVGVYLEPCACCGTAAARPASWSPALDLLKQSGVEFGGHLN